MTDAARYEALMDVVRHRMTNRAFAPADIPRAHFEMILEAARHAPSGANAQPWHYIVVTDPAVKAAIGQCFVDEQQHARAAAHGLSHAQLQRREDRARASSSSWPTSASSARSRCSTTAPTLDRLYQQNAERILLQSVAASTMSAHLAAAALGYAVWWITAIGQEDIQKQVSPLLGVPDALGIIDVMCFGPPLKPSYKRWKKRLDQIASWDRFDPANLMTDEEIDEWMKTTRHKVMYRDESRVD